MANNLALTFQSSSSAASHSSSSLTTTEYRATYCHINPSFVSSRLPDLQQTTSVLFESSAIQEDEDIDKLIAKAHSSSSYSPKMKVALQKVLDDTVILAGLNPKVKPETVNIPSARDTLSKLINISGTHYKDLRTEALQYLFKLILLDPVNLKSAEGVVELVMNLIDMLEKKLIQKEVIDTQIWLATIYGPAIELIIRHYGRGHIGAITKELKRELKQRFDILDNFNTQKDPKLTYAIQFALEAIKRLTTDESATKEILGRLKHFVTALGKAYNKEFGAFISEMLIAFEDLDSKIKMSWFKNLFILRELASQILTPSESQTNLHNLKHIQKYNLKLIQKLIKDKMSSDWRFANGALLVLARIAFENKDPEIRKAAFYGVNLEDCGSIDETLPGIVNFINFHLTNTEFDNEHIRMEAVKILMSFASNDTSEFCYPSRKMLLAHFLNGETDHVKAEMGIIIPKDKSKQQEWISLSKPILVDQRATVSSRPSSPASVRQVTYCPTKTIQESDESLIGKGRGRGIAITVGPKSQFYSKEFVLPTPSAPSFEDLHETPKATLHTTSKTDVVTPDSSLKDPIELFEKCLKGNFDVRELAKIVNEGIAIDKNGLEISLRGMRKFISFLESSDVSEIDLCGCRKVEGLAEFLAKLPSTNVKSITLSFQPSSDELECLCSAIKNAPNLTNVTLKAELNKEQIELLAQAAVDANASQSEKAVQTDDDATAFGPKKVGKFILISLTKDPKQMNLLGMAIKRKGDFKLAVQHYIAGIELHYGNPNVKVLIFNYGISLFNSGEIDEAIRCFEKVLTIDRNSYITLRELSKSYYKRYQSTKNLADKTKAYEYIKEAIEKGPSDPLNHYNLMSYIGDEWREFSNATTFKEYVSEMTKTESLFLKSPEFQISDSGIWKFIQKHLPIYKEQLHSEKK